MPGLGFAAGFADQMNQNVTNDEKRQQMAYQKLLMEKARSDQARELAANQYAGNALGGMMQGPPPLPGAQAPPPGQSSAPPQQMQGPPQQMQGPPPKPPAPMNMNFPNATPDLTKGMQTGPQTAPPQPPGLAAPQPQEAPPQVQQPEQGGMSSKFTVENLIQTLKSQGVPEEHYAGVVQKLSPLFNEVNQEQARHLQYEKEKAAEAKALVQQKLMEQKEDRMERHNAAMEKHAINMEGLGQQRIGQGQQRIDKVAGGSISGVADPNVADNAPQKSLAGWSKDGYEIAVKRTILEGTSTLSRYSKDQKALIDNGIAEVAKGANMTPQELLSQAPERKAKALALNQTEKDLSMITPFKEMLDLNGTIAAQLAHNVMKTDSKLANTAINKLSSNVTNNPDLAEFLAQIEVVQAEANRVINNPRLVGTLSFEAKKEMNAILDGSMTLESTERVINRLKKDGDNRINKMADQTQKLRSSLEGTEKPSKADAGWGEFKPKEKSIVKTGTLNGKKVIQYSDGTTEYAN